MIVVKINEAQFEYDIHSLIKAFYPGVEVKVLGWDTEAQSEEGMPEFEVEFQRKGKESGRICCVQKTG